MGTDGDSDNSWLCIALGFFLPLIGLIIGAIIGKADGVKNALWGALFRYMLIVGGCLWLFSPSSSAPAAHGSSAPIESGKRTANMTWEIGKDKSPLDDSTIYMVSREAESPVGDGFRKAPPLLILRHKEGNSEAYISWPLYLSHDELPVTIRFDDDQATTENWNCSTDGKAVFSPIPFDVFFGKVLASRRLVVRLTPFGESPETAIFDLSGLADILDDETRAAFKVRGW